MKYNIYCDESCHLPNDNSSVMVIGGMCCPVNKTKVVSEQIRQIKRKHGVYEFAEIKWTKVSNSKIQMYKDIIDVVFDNSFISFRSVIATNKRGLNLKKFGLSYDDWYHRIYYLVLKEMISIDNQYTIYLDIKDTKGSEKINALKVVLNRTLYDFVDETVNDIQLIRSDQVQLVQVVDLIIGAISYTHRGLDTNVAKMELIKHIKLRSGRSLLLSTPKSEGKFNLFLWEPRRES